MLCWKLDAIIANLLWRKDKPVRRYWDMECLVGIWEGGEKKNNTARITLSCVDFLDGISNTEEQNGRPLYSISNVYSLLAVRLDVMDVVFSNSAKKEIHFPPRITTFDLTLEDTCWWNIICKFVVALLVPTRTAMCPKALLKMLHYKNGVIKRKKAPLPQIEESLHPRYMIQPPIPLARHYTSPYWSRFSNPTIVSFLPFSSFPSFQENILPDCKW